MVINVHAGHNPHGKVACGAVGLISESLENRRVKILWSMNYGAWVTPFMTVQLKTVLHSLMC